jgi:hypothetical protein
MLAFKDAEKWLLHPTMQMRIESPRPGQCNDGGIHSRNNPAPKVEGDHGLYLPRLPERTETENPRRDHRRGFDGSHRSN